MSTVWHRLFRYRIHHPDPLVEWKLNTFDRILTRGLIPLMLPFILLPAIYHLWWMVVDVAVLIGIFSLCVVLIRKSRLLLSVSLTAIGATISDLTLLFFLHITDSLYFSVLIIIIVGIFCGTRAVVIWTGIEIVVLCMISLILPGFSMLPGIAPSTDIPAGIALTGTYFLSACLLYGAGAFISILFWKFVAELLVVKSQLVQMQKLDSLGFFAGNVSHEWNHGLTRIKSCANLILKKSDDSMEDLRTYAKSIINSCIHITEASARLLAFTRKTGSVNSTVYIHDLLENTVSLLVYLVEKKIRLVMELSAQQTAVRGNYSQLQIVLMNLAANAADAMPDGGTLTFKTGNPSKKHAPATTQKQSTHIVISVEDTGTGMDTDALSKLYSPFFTKDKESGTGLGLVLAKKLLDEHEGTISASSEKGKGTIFSIVLPLAQLREPLVPPAFSEKTDTIPEKTDIGRAAHDVSE